MRHKYTRPSQPGGISATYRHLLSRLHRDRSGPFTVSEAASVMELDSRRAANLLAYWAARGWLSRVRRGLYITVPLAAKNPSSQRADPWIVAMSLFTPGYIGGWSACEHWGLTEQIFADVVVFTTRKVRTRQERVQDTSFMLRVIPQDRMWGTVAVWHNQTKVLVSDPSRTLADILDEPGIGGGMRQIAEVLENYFASEYRDDGRLLDFISRLGNRTICKRLGFLVETLAIAAPQIVAYCQSHLSAGYSKLDPTVAAQGRLMRRWNLEVNVHLDKQQGKR